MKYERLKRTALALFVGGLFTATATAASSSSATTEASKKDLALVAAGVYNNTQLLTGLNTGDKIIETDNNGKITEKTATDDDVKNAPFEGAGIIGAVEDNRRELSKFAEEASTAMQNLGENVEALNDNIEDLNTTVFGANDDDKDKGLVGAVEANKSRIDNAAIALGLLSDSIKANKDKIAEKADKSDVEANKSRIDNAAIALGLLTSNIKVNKDKIEEKADKSDVEANKTEIAKKADKSDVEANKTEIAKKADKSDVEANKTEIAKKADKSDVEANKTEIAKKADKSDVEANKTEIAKKANKNEVYTKTETDNKFALKADSSVVNAQGVDIGKLRNDVTAHGTRLDKLDRHVDHLDRRVDKLSKEIKRGLAAQAALTGLFQPYNVGKANFTAAVGGYKSQTAVALGTGYRYNEYVASKAGVAFSQGGGVSYNMGINFEW